MPHLFLIEGVWTPHLPHANSTPPLTKHNDIYIREQAVELDGLVEACLVAEQGVLIPAHTTLLLPLLPHHVNVPCVHVAQWLKRHILKILSA